MFTNPKDLPRMGNIVIYGAGNMGLYTYKYLTANGLMPLCFCDEDTSKHHKQPYYDCDLLCLSFNEAVSKYGDDFNIYISVDNMVVKFEIEDYLVNTYKVSKGRIINFDDYYRGWGCSVLENQICPFSNTYIDFRCQCRFYNYFALPKADWKNNDTETALDEFISNRRVLKQQLIDEPEKSPCYGCSRLCDGYWSTSNGAIHFDIVAYSTTKNSLCNMKCKYCYGLLHLNNTNVEDRRIELLDLLEQREVVSVEKTQIILSDGEITVDPHRDELLALYNRGYYICIFTNAGIFSQKIADMLSNGNSEILVSVDAGTKETFRRLKGVDTFDKVCSNLLKYSKTGGTTELKYVLIDNENDNEDDIRGFIELCQKCNNINLLRDIRFSVDFTRSREMLPENTMRLFRYANKLCAVYGLPVSFNAPHEFSAVEHKYITNK